MTQHTSYWAGNRKYQALYEELNKLIPVEGEVLNKQQNRALERLRKAANCYYDLHNNGLCNRAAQFRQVFGFGGKWIADSHFPHYEPMEQKMDMIILAAAKEQGVEVITHESFDPVI